MTKCGRKPGKVMIDEGRIMTLHLDGHSAADIATRMTIPEKSVNRVIKGNLNVWRKQNWDAADWQSEFYAVSMSLKRRLKGRH